ncbi:MAG: hypothetical protein AAF714_05405 [Pseudomonadota bacterium]
MKKMMMSAALGALVISTTAATPARATDPVAVGAAIKLLIGVGALIGPAARSTGTSVNTEYALTGQGMPVASAAQAAGDARVPVMLQCNAHGTHCEFVPMMMGSGD